MHKVLIYFHHLDGNHLNLFTYRVIINPNFDALFKVLMSEFTSGRPPAADGWWATAAKATSFAINLYEATLDE